MGDSAEKRVYLRSSASGGWQAPMARRGLNNSHVRRILLQRRSWITLARTLLGAMVHGEAPVGTVLPAGQPQLMPSREYFT